MSDKSPPNQQAFYEQVWSLVRQVPRGKVVTYGQVAQLLPPPAEIDLETYQALSPRWVGSAMAACPPDVPWQRVINAQGKISDRPGAQRQRHLLEQEGIVFVKDKVNPKVYQWRGPGREDEPWQAELGINEVHGPAYRKEFIMRQENFTSEEDVIRQLEEQERQAVLNQDLAALERLWSEEFIVNNPQNQLSMNRGDVLALIKRGLIRYSAFERRIESIRFNADIAIVMGAETVEPVGDAPRAGGTVERRFTNIWKKQDAAWHMIARHANVIAPVPGHSAIGSNEYKASS